MGGAALSSLRPPEPSGHRDAVFGLCRGPRGVLLVQNARVVRGGLSPEWDLPGGTLEPGEDLERALLREWREETGLEARVGALRLVVDGRKRAASEVPPLYTWRAFVFDVEASGDPVPGAGIEAAAWVDPTEARARLAAPYHEALRDHLAGDERLWRRVDWVEAPAAGAVDARIPRALLVIAAAAATGASDLLAREVRAARSAGVPVAAIEETLLQLVPYAGFPRAIAAFTAARPLLGPPAAETLRDVAAPERRARGEDAFSEVYGDAAERVVSGLRALHPALADWTLEKAYGRVLSRGGVLSLRDRELLAVAILTALGGLSDPLLGHMRAARRLGADRDQVAAAISVVPDACGPGLRDAARRLLPRL